MSMKATVMAVLAVVLVVAVHGPMLPARCPALIKHASEQFVGMDRTSEKVQQVKALLAEADRFHKAGNHYLSIATVQAALVGLQ